MSNVPKSVSAHITQVHFIVMTASSEKEKKKKKKKRKRKDEGKLFRDNEMCSSMFIS